MFELVCPSGADDVCSGRTGDQFPSLILHDRLVLGVHCPLPLCPIFPIQDILIMHRCFGSQACERTERTEIEYCSDSSRGARGCSVSISVRPSRVGLCSVSSRPIPNRADLILGSVCSARGLPCISINLNL